MLVLKRSMREVPPLVKSVRSQRAACKLNQVVWVSTSFPDEPVESGLKGRKLPVIPYHV